ncbi:MAG: WD40 repeat domain-containing protein [Planctomycetota bacterium]|jgi:hypothetical protein
MGLNLALIITILLTRERWDAWIVESRGLDGGTPKQWDGWVAEKRGPVGGTPMGVVASSRNARRALIYWTWNHGLDIHRVLWDIEASRSLATYWQWHSNFAALSPDGTKMVATVPGDERNETVLFDGKTGGKLAVLAGSWDLHGLTTGSFSPDGRHIISAAGAPDGYVRVWSAVDGSLVLKLGKHKGGAHGAEFSPNGETILTIGLNDFRLWDARTGELRARLVDGDAGLTGARFCAGGRNVFIWSDELGLLVEAASGERLLELGACYTCAVSDSGREIAVYGKGGSPVAILDATSGDTLLRTQLGRVFRLRFADGGRRLLAGYRKGLGYVNTLLDTRTGEVLGEFPYKPPDRGLTLSLDGTRLLTHKPWTEKERWTPVQLYSVKTGRLLAEWPEAEGEGFLGSDRIILSSRGEREGPRILRRIRPEQWWGVLALWHFWLIVALGGALAWSGWRDTKRMRGTATGIQQGCTG